MSEFAQVSSKIGVVLRTFTEVEGPFGVKSFPEKDRFTLDRGTNDVPKEFFASWLEANFDSDLLKEGVITHNMENESGQRAK